MNKGDIPNKGEINQIPYKQTLVKFRGCSKTVKKNLRS